MRARASLPSVFRTVLTVGLFGLLAPSAGCNKDEPKKIPQEEKKATPVPSDMVFNDFLPQGGGAAGGMAVRVDGGTLEAGTGETAATDGGAGAPAADVAGKMKVVEAGAEPRAARKYTFVANRSERRVLTIRTTQTAQGQTQEQPPLAFTVDLVAKEVKPTSAKFEMKLVKADLADKDKVDPRLVQAASQQLAPLVGLTATFEADVHGEIGELSLSGTEKMQREGAEGMIDALRQISELVLPPLPDAPIGVGAKWERDESGNEGGVQESGKRTLELKEVTAEGGTIVASLEKNVPKRAVPDPRARGAMMEVHATGSYTYSFRFDRIASKVVGDQTQTVKFEVPNPEGKGDKKAMIQEVKMKHTLETAK